MIAQKKRYQHERTVSTIFMLHYINMHSGFILIDKPSGPTSHDIVDAVRHVAKIRQVGHAGTLDPFASGLLIIGVDKATKEMSRLVGLDKEYVATLTLGATSDTFDRTGKISESKTVSFSENEIKSVLKKFTGAIEQIPPMFSAKKVKGKKLYELARAGITIERKPVSLIIHELHLISFSKNELTIRVRSSSGTYIRSLADDIGQALGYGAYLKELRRTAIGPFRVDRAVTLSRIPKEPIETYLKTIDEVISILG